MDGLIVLLVIFGIINAITSKNKKEKQAKKSAAQAQAFESAIPKAQTKAKPRPQPKAKPQPKPKADERQTRLPFTREEWKAYLNELSEELVATKAASSSKPAYDEGERFHEGFISTQGESAEEHAEHRRRIAEEEAQRHQELEALNDLRHANREKLRAAVVMSEVLGKPVALRPRIGYHR